MSSTPDSQPAPTTYDETPYPASAHSQTHPSRLSAMGRLFGVATTDLAQARVLELGCADGSNLLPMADQFPQATFLGLDASQVQIAAGRKALEAAGLKNVELRQQNILEFPATEGKFDYIIVHGIFSWVPEPVRQKILAICQEQLSPNGVAYISYNALPGWNMRRSLRDMMLFHTKEFPDPRMKVQQSRALLAFLSESVSAEKSAYGMLLKSELEFMKDQPDNYLRHDILEEENTPFYFHDFVGRAASYGLQYLGEPGLAQMLASNFPDKVRDTLAQVGGQLLRQEQYMDFVRNRTFRQTLLCRKEIQLRRNVAGESMVNFAFRSLLKSAPADFNLTPGVSATFNSTGDVKISTPDTFVKALLLVLTKTGGSNALSYRSLLEACRELARPYQGEITADQESKEEDTLQVNLLNLFSKGFVELYMEPVVFEAKIPARPAASGLVRYQAANARYITNRVHNPMPADLLARHIVQACDGTRTPDEILTLMVERARNGQFQVKEGETPMTDPAKIRGALAKMVTTVLTKMATEGLFRN